MALPLSPLEAYPWPLIGCAEARIWDVGTKEERDMAESEFLRLLDFARGLPAVSHAE